MFKPVYDQYTRRLEKINLPCCVMCHRSEDESLFTDNPEFNHATHGFGWVDTTYAYTCGQLFSAPTGLDAVLLYHHSLPESKKRPPLTQRGVDLYTFAAGKYVDRIEVASFMITGERSTGAHDGSEDHIPIDLNTFEIKLARIQSNGLVHIRHVYHWSGKESDESILLALLLEHPRYRVLSKVKVEERGQVYEFSDGEISQLETAIAEYKNITELLQPTIEEAVRCKYGEMNEGAWKLVAGTLGLSVSAVRKSKNDRDTWWDGYARMHDGVNPNEE
jgi:hypothetical protein